MSDRSISLGDSRASAFALHAAVALGFVVATAAAAHVRIPLPFTPVPITLQTAVVLLAGGVLGGAWGCVAMAAYLAAGVAGAPVFAGDHSGGAATLLGATGGYLLAFAVVPAIVARTLPPEAGWLRAAAVLLAASGIVLLWGMLQLALVLGHSLDRAFALGVAPFLVGDVLKVAAAASAFRSLRPLARTLRA